MTVFLVYQPESSSIRYFTTYILVVELLHKLINLSRPMTDAKLQRRIWKPCGIWTGIQPSIFVI